MAGLGFPLVSAYQNGAYRRCSFFFSTQGVCGVLPSSEWTEDVDSEWIGGDRRHGEGLVPWGLQRGVAAAAAAEDEGVSQCVE